MSTYREGDVIQLMGRVKELAEEVLNAESRAVTAECALELARARISELEDTIDIAHARRQLNIPHGVYALQKEPSWSALIVEIEGRRGKGWDGAR